MLEVFDKNGNKLKLVTADYKEIIDEIINKETNCYIIERAFVENNIVYIKGGIKSGVEFNESLLLPEKYAPRTITLANVQYKNTKSDNNKIQYLAIDYDGTIKGWIFPLNDYEPFIFMYPLRS